MTVMIYTRKFCGYCSSAKMLLTKKGADFTEHDVTGNASLKSEMVQKAGGAATFPQIFIGGQHIGGCDDLFALDKAGKLDDILADAG